MEFDMYTSNSDKITFLVIVIKNWLTIIDTSVNMGDNMHKRNRVPGFTIVELLIVIVVIGILAAIVTIAYNGVTNKARDAVLVSDLSTNAKLLSLHRLKNRSYPANGNESQVNNNQGLSVSKSTVLTYESDSANYCLQASNNGSSYFITNSYQSPAAGTCSGIVGVPAEGGGDPISPSTVFVFDTRNDECDGTVYLPISSPTSGGTVHWGDGTTGSLNGRWTSHTYSSAGEYTVTYNGPIDRAEYYDTYEDEYHDDYFDSNGCLTRVNFWGRGAKPTSINFDSASNLVYVAKPPNTVTSMNYMFWDAYNFNQPIDNWDVSNVVEMSGMFYGADSFNQPLDSWDVSNVDDMDSMFAGAFSFNQPLDSWDVSNVDDMDSMFEYASSFNRPLDSWDVSNVSDMGSMFDGASSFNQSIGNWNVSSVEDTSFMFNDASSFNQPIGNWDVSNVYYMWNMFNDASSFNQPIGNWDVTNVVYMWSMFEGATSFNQPLGNWDVSNIEDMDGMFCYASSFNQNISNWNVTSVSSWAGFRYSSPLSSANTPLKFRGDASSC